MAPGTRVWLRLADGAGWGVVAAASPLACDCGQVVYPVRVDGACGYLHESDLIPVPAALPAGRVQDGGRA